jgi:hypothetical protein
MDVTLYVVALLAFAILYLVLSIFLVFALIITLLFLFLYLAVRYGNLAENYKQGFGDIMTTIIFIGVTWTIFVLFGPKNPVPFVPQSGQGLTYTTASALPVPAVIAVAIIFSLVMLVVFAFGYARGDRRSGAQPVTTSESKPKQGVGA